MGSIFEQSLIYVLFFFVSKSCLIFQSSSLFLIIFETGIGFLVLLDLVGEVSMSLINALIAYTFKSVREFDCFMRKTKAL